MRSLKLKDAFVVSRILKKIKIRPEVKENSSQEQFGADLIIGFFEGMGDAEVEVSGFLADLLGITAEELLNKDFDEMGTIIAEFKELKGLKGFFTQVGKLMK
jgi:hypothetical protein